MDLQAGGLGCDFSWWPPIVTTAATSAGAWRRRTCVGSFLAWVFLTEIIQQQQTNLQLVPGIATVENRSMMPHPG